MITKLTGTLGLLMLAACTPIIAQYSLESYANATMLKAQTIAVIDSATEPYPAHAAEVRKLQTDLSAAYEFSRGMPYNRVASAMWGIIRNPDEKDSLLGEFFARWRARKDAAGAPAGFRQAYVDGKRKNIVFAFDRLICLEANKKAAARCPAYPGAPPTAATPDSGDATPAKE
jgi:hypothetical protein